ncbi:hypothetical protein GXW83_31230 [Streptacidiphilus sp. PB12-B1b]|uniref:hypothetical protein n=1 Tax=Streptacidiphilus sp. PB12-B1b TaxID=2705012 RepID=UPI0015F9C872|nr:hypothetical protein [Streptacidiphilus sp. PB12-B1b]QMU79512.1 hypothetical protein GXW83_31230 [Streptacidiphilus sp. PB12-B1b]
MNLSARATAIAAAVCASAGLAAGTAAATPLTPAQTAAAENAAAQEQVPFDLPLGGAARQLTGSTASTAGVDGAVPAALVLPPSSQAGQSAGPSGPTAQTQDPQLVPDPLVPALDTTRKTPAVGVTAPLAAPLSGPDDHAKPNAVDLSVPSAPLRTVGSAVSLGHPLTYHSGSTRSMTPDHGTVDLGSLNPSVTEPQLHTDPRGRLDLDQGGSRKPLTQGVDELVASAGALGQGLQQH